ncbi:MAG: TlyA family RNA methyltransferase [Christensenellales bacterium]|jgi:23S rRNA (cytidine1920-2'-O)/16S rRNA (cytidine1409-2'-O)-methyltransferase
MKPKRRRADELLLEQCELSSIRLARALILEGRALSGDTPIQSAAQLLRTDAKLRIKGELDGYVSRGAHKLKRAIDAFEIDLRGRVCIDIGAAAGGFTDVMLRAGAGKVYAVDVGYNLLDYRIRSDPRVVPMERVNARLLAPGDLPEAPDFGATDVSFISLKAVLPPVLSLMSGDARFVALIKPQFEAAQEQVEPGGVVRDPSVHKQVISSIVEWLPSQGWSCAGLDFSPITGPAGNIEFLVFLAPARQLSNKVDESTIETTIRAAYDKFFKSANLGL